MAPPKHHLKKPKRPSAAADKAPSNLPDPELGHTKAWYWAVVIIAVLVSWANTNHIARLFENDRHFSHLADFEREMTYRTEMGLYYSYYKTLIEADSFGEGLQEIIKDDVTEYGHTINTLKRFNLYPEIITAWLYRHFKAYADSIGWRVQNCWQVNRGGGLPPVESCEGIGNAHYFYTGAVFTVAGLTAGMVFVLGTTLSDSIGGGLLAIAAFAFNHGEATRVQWTPPLRESWSYPLILTQITLVTVAIKSHASGTLWCFGIGSLGLLSMLSWQFAQFVYSTQLCALALVFVLDFIPRSTYSTLVYSHFISIFSSYALLFGNEMLLSSLYFPCITASMFVLLSDRLLNKVEFRPAFVAIMLGIFGGVAISSKLAIANFMQVEDDAHIFEILSSKFTDFATFHTRLYTCSAEFSFISQEAVEKLTLSLVLPVAISGAILAALFFLRTQSILWREVDAPRTRPLGHVLYHVAQTAAFVVMAVLIMRLKLFATPHLCATAALVMSYSLAQSALSVRLSPFVRFSFGAAVVAAMAYHGMGNIKKQLSVQGEYSNAEQEALFDWINNKTPIDAVFAGTMPVMANVKLSTGRPIVNHPHYEDAGIRERTLKVYSMFSKKPIQEVYDTLAGMGVDYVVIQPFNCDHHPRKECSYRSMWDLHDPSNIKRPSLCDIWQSAYKKNPKEANKMVAPFKFAYNHKTYIVFSL